MILNTVMSIPTAKEIEGLENNTVLMGLAKGGRKSYDVIHRTTRETLHSAAMPAARLLREFVIGERVKKISRTRLDACIFIIEQVIGKAKIKVEHDIGDLTYDALVRLATEKQKRLEAGKPVGVVDLHEQSLQTPIIEGEFVEVIPGANKDVCSE